MAKYKVKWRKVPKLIFFYFPMLIELWEESVKPELNRVAQDNPVIMPFVDLMTDAIKTVLVRR